MHIRLRLNPHGVRSLTVDGTEIGPAVESILVSSAGGRHHATVVLAGTIDLDAPVHIELPLQTVHALKTLGWTPPADAGLGGTPAATAVRGVPR